MNTHEQYMLKALDEAAKAAEEGEIPVGAIIVCKGKIIARAHNETEKLNDVTAHAEMIAITMATSFLGGKYLNECTLYVTMEPCTMCAGALAWAPTRRTDHRCIRSKPGVYPSFPVSTASTYPGNHRNPGRKMQRND